MKLEDSFPTPQGRTLVQMLWEELDAIVDRLHVEPEPKRWWLGGEDDLDAEVGDPDEWRGYGELRGQAQGVAYAIAVITDPYSPNIEAVRKVSVERRKAREKNE